MIGRKLWAIAEGYIPPESQAADRAIAAQARRCRPAGVLLALGIGGAALLLGRRQQSQRPLARLISRAVEG